MPTEDLFTPKILEPLSEIHSSVVFALDNDYFMNIVCRRDAKSFNKNTCRVSCSIKFASN